MRRNLAIVAASVAVLTAWAHWPAVRNGLVNWDDDIYLETVQRHPRLSGETVRWAFTSLVPFYYHPLTWLSHVADDQVFGSNWKGPHAVNVVLHGANAALVVLLLGMLLRSVAGLSDGARLSLATGVGVVFAIHPLQVESVAWLAERKNLLCGLFSLGCLVSYVVAVRERASKGWRAATGGLFVAALLSKPMAVSLPVVMLALDYYPLERQKSVTWRTLLLEKLPYVIFAAGLSALTVIGQVQWGAVKPLDDLGMLERLLVAARGMAFYLKKLIWPSWLSPYYPLGGQPSVTQAEFLVPLSLFLALTGLAWWQRRRVPSLVTAWVVYVAWLLPVSGVMQVGPQAAADRFMYLALLGPVAVAGQGCLWLWQRLRMVGRCALVVLLSGLTLCQIVKTREMIRVWHDEETLWREVLRYFPDSGAGNFHLAMALVDQWRFAEALPHARYAVTIIDDNPLAHATLGVIYLKTGHFQEAVPELQEALRRQPEDWSAQYNLACAHTRLGQFAEAYDTLRDLLDRQPHRIALAGRDPELKALREHPDYGPRLAEASGK